MHVYGPAGGGTDIQARVLSAVFHDNTSQLFIVENRAGASGLIGNDTALDSDACTMATNLERCG